MQKSLIRKIEFRQDVRLAITRILKLGGEVPPKNFIVLFLELHPECAELAKQGSFARNVPGYEALKKAIRGAMEKIKDAYTYAQYGDRLGEICPSSEDREFLLQIIDRYPRGRYFVVTMVDDFFGATPRGVRHRAKAQTMGEHT